MKHHYDGSKVVVAGYDTTSVMGDKAITATVLEMT
jgi:hypothetical protein